METVLGNSLEPRVAALESMMALANSDLFAMRMGNVGVGGMIENLSPPSNKRQDIYGGGGVFRHRWQVTYSAREGGGYTLSIARGSVWKAEAGTLGELAILSGTGVTATTSGWTVDVAASANVYVAQTVDGSIYLRAGVVTSEIDTVLLRVADLDVKSSGATLIQRQVGDALIAAGGGGLVPGPLEYEDKLTRFARYMGAWTFNRDNGKWLFAHAIDPATSAAYPPAETFEAKNGLFRDLDSDAICTLPLPMFADAMTPWLYKKTQNIGEGVSYTPPPSENGTGWLAANSTTITYYTDTNPKTESNTLLSVQVASANERTNYQDDAGGD